MGKWAARNNTVRISGPRPRWWTDYALSLRGDLTRVFGPVEQVFIWNEDGDDFDAIAIFKEVQHAKAALAARTIVIGRKVLRLSEPSNEECSKVGTWRKYCTESKAGLAEAWSPPRPHSLWYPPDSRIHHEVQPPIRNNARTPPTATPVRPTSIISARPTVTPDDSISPKLSPVRKPQVVSSSAEAPSLTLGTQSQPTTQAHNQTDPATTIALQHKKPAVTTKITDRVVASIGTGPSRQDLTGLTATCPIRPSGAVVPSPQPPTPTNRTTAPGCASPNLAATGADSAAPPLTPVCPRSSTPPTSTPTTSTPSTHALPSFPSNATLAPKIQALPLSHPTLSTAPVVASPILGGSQSNISSTVVPSTVAFGTVQRHTQNHSIFFPFQNQSPTLQTCTQTLNSMSSLEARREFSNSGAAIAAGATPANPLSSLQGSLSGAWDDAKLKADGCTTFVGWPVGTQQALSQNQFGPSPVHPPVARPVHPHPQSIFWMGGGQQAALAYNRPPTQVTATNSTSLRPLPAPAGSSVNQGDPRAIVLTRAQVHTFQTTHNELRKAYEEVVNARSKTEEELKSERTKSEELSKRLEAAEKVVKQMKHEQETSDNRHREELDRARGASAEQMKADVEAINEEWTLKLRESEARLLQELEQAKRQANEERELSSEREGELRERLQALGDQGDWNSKLEAAEEDRLKLQQELADLNQAFLRADAGAQVELGRRQELEQQLDDCWARERAQPELVKAFLLLDGVARTNERRTGSIGLDSALNLVKMEDPPDSPVRGEAKRRRLQ